MSQIKLTADSGGGTTSLKAPSSTTSNADVVLKLPVADGSSGQVLKTDGSGQLSFGSDISDLVNDTSPQLGGDLASNGNDILLADNDFVKVGTGNDLTLSHNGTNSFIANNTGELQFQADDVRFYTSGASETHAKFINNAAVELYHDNSKKFETTSSGVEIHNDLLLDGSANLGNYIRTNYDGGGHMYFKNNSQGANYSSHFQTYLSSDEGGTTQTHMHYYHGGYAELLHQGNSSVRTLSNGTQFRNGGNVNGQITPNGIAFGSDTATANSLHDYEYGSWTPAYAATGGNYGTLSYSVQTGQYVKIGRLVFVQFYINYTFGSVGGNWRISGLPYSANSYGAGSVMMSNHTTDNDKWYVLHVSNDSYLYLYGTENNTGWASAAADASGAIIGSCTYYTTS